MGCGLQRDGVACVRYSPTSPPPDPLHHDMLVRPFMQAKVNFILLSPGGGGCRLRTLPRLSCCPSSRTKETSFRSTFLLKKLVFVVDKGMYPFAF